MNGVFVHTCRLLPLLLMLALLPVAVSAGETPPHRHGSEPSPAAQSASVGLDERLGAKIPLDIVFRDEAGTMVSLAELVTVPTIILPVYYSCTNVCNFLQQGLARALPAVQRLPGKEFRVLSVSFDESETPQLAARYQRTYLAAIQAPFPPEGWRFLTGDSAAIHRLTDAAGYRFQRQGRDFLHPVASFVVSRDGTIVRYLYGTTFLPKDLTMALLEARDGTVGTTIRTVVGYCFSFDPQGKTYVFNLLKVSATVVMGSAVVLFGVLLLSGRRRRHPPKEQP